MRAGCLLLVYATRTRVKSLGSATVRLGYPPCGDLLHCGHTREINFVSELHFSPYLNTVNEAHDVSSSTPGLQIRVIQGVRCHLNEADY